MFHAVSVYHRTCRARPIVEDGYLTKAPVTLSTLIHNPNYNFYINFQLLSYLSEELAKLLGGVLLMNYAFDTSLCRLCKLSAREVAISLSLCRSSLLVH